MYLKARELYIENFRNIKNKTFYLGKKITVFAGQNGVGKSNIMSLIATTFGKGQNRIVNKNFQPEFYDYFTIPPSEEYGAYRSYLKISYNNTDNYVEKRHSYKDDTEQGRGIRIIPRASNHFSTEKNYTIKNEQEKHRELLDIGDSARIPVPTIYISLRRLFPSGETSISEKTLDIRNQLYKNQSIQKFIEWYNFVLPNSISSEHPTAGKIVKERIDDDSLHVDLDSASVETLSMGQDNLRSIITALVDFYNFKCNKPDEYNGGVLCIDEIDASLHPSAQVKLFNLLEKLSGELNLQIFMTTHSLTILEKIILLQKHNSENYKLNYIVDPENPSPTPIDDIKVLKADLFDDKIILSPKVKIYCEDEYTAFLFEELISAYYELNSTAPKLPSYQIIPVHLGKNQLINLPENDSHFKKVLIVLDGDAATKSTQNILFNYLNNIDMINNLDKRDLDFNYITLPTFLAPESYMYYIIYQLYNDNKYLNFWSELMNMPETIYFSKSRINRDIISKVSINNNTQNKDIKNLNIDSAMKEFIKDSHALANYYRSSDSNELKNFFLSVDKAMKRIITEIKSSY